MKKAMNTHKWSTPIIIGSGVFISLSGVLMFFGIHNPIALAHEWIGLVFALGIILHIANHWRPFKKYFSQGLAITIVATVLVATSGFIAFSASQSGSSGDIKMNIIRSIENSPLTEVAPIVNKSTVELVKLFESKGYTVSSSSESAQSIAKANGIKARQLMGIMFAK